MALRMDDSDKLKNNLKPSGMQSTGEQAEGMLDTAASYLPGNSKPRDALNDDAAKPNLTHDSGRAGGLDAFKPSGEQGIGGTMKTKLDQGMSHAQPEGDKSFVQQVRDTITPGNASAPQKEGQGLLDRAAGAMKDMKDAVVGTGPGTHHETR